MVLDLCILGEMGFVNMFFSKSDFFESGGEGVFVSVSVVLV